MNASIVHYKPNVVYRVRCRVCLGLGWTKGGLWCRGCRGRGYRWIAGRLEATRPAGQHNKTGWEDWSI